MGVRANVSLLFAHRFFANLIPAYVIERLFWEQRGMTIALVVVLAGIGRATQSGAENALLYDSLQQVGHVDKFEKRVGQLNAGAFVAATLAALSGSLLASRFDLSLNYWLSAGSALVAFVLVMLLVEPARRQPSTEQRDATPFRHHVLTALRFFRGHPGLVPIVLSGIVTGVALSHVYEYWQLYVSRLGVPVAYFGAISTGFMLLQLPGNLLAHRLLKRFRARTLLSAATAVLALGLAVAAACKSVVGLVALFVLCLGAGVVAPIVTGYVHHRTDSSIRATVESVQSLGAEAVAAVTALGFGSFSTRWDVFGGYGFLAVVCGTFIVWLIVGRHERRRSDTSRESVP